MQGFSILIAAQNRNPEELIHLDLKKEGLNPRTVNSRKQTSITATRPETNYAIISFDIDSKFALNIIDCIKKKTLETEIITLIDTKTPEEVHAIKGTRNR